MGIDGRHGGDVDLGHQRRAVLVEQRLPGHHPARIGAASGDPAEIGKVGRAAGNDEAQSQPQQLGVRRQFGAANATLHVAIEITLTGNAGLFGRRLPVRVLGVAIRGRQVVARDQEQRLAQGRECVAQQIQHLELVVGQVVHVAGGVAPGALQAVDQAQRHRIVDTLEDDRHVGDGELRRAGEGQAGRIDGAVATDLRLELLNRSDGLRDVFDPHHVGRGRWQRRRSLAACGQCRDQLVDGGCPHRGEHQDMLLGCGPLAGRQIG